MSQEDEPFLGGGGVGEGKDYTDGCVWLHLYASVCVCVCVCVCLHMPALICVHFISIKTHSPP